MRLTVFGATGGTGTQVVQQALDAGDHVTAVVRDLGRLTVPAHDRLDIVIADVMDAAAIEPVVRDADAVLTAIGHRGRGPTSVVADSTRAILRAMDKAGTRRFLLTSAAALAAGPGDDPLTRYLVKPVILQRLLRHAMADMRRAEDEVRAGDLDWTIVRPPRLTDNAAKGVYRTAFGTNVRFGYQITRADLATCLLALVPDGAAVHEHVSVAN